VQNSPYERALDAAHAELAELVQQRVDLDKRISQLKVTAEALAALMGISPKLNESVQEQSDEAGVSEAIRRVLRSSPVPLTPGEIKAKLTENGFDAGVHAADGDVIHNTLKHLEQQGDISLVGSVYLAVSL
jgi:hypothetical protein